MRRVRRAGTIPALLGAASLLGAAPAQAAVLPALRPPSLLAPAPAADTATGRLLVHLRLGATLGSIAGLSRSGPAIPQLGIVSVTPRAGAALAPLLARLDASGRVASVEVEHRYAPRALPNDPAFSQFETDPAAPKGTPLDWPLTREHFTDAWKTANGKGALVAVIDTGVAATHPDLKGKIAGAMDYSGAGRPETDPDGHGTHVAALACAGTNNRIGGAGAGNQCRVLALRTDLSDAAVAAAIVYATDHGAHAITMSFGDDGTTPSDAVAAAVRYAFARNVVLVAAAADQPVSEQGEPANLLQPAGSGGGPVGGQLGMTVTAATYAGERASFAGAGSELSIAAYGLLDVDQSGTRGLFAAYPGVETPRESPPSIPCSCRATLDGDHRYAFLAGTSMAVPQVAALAAMIRVRFPALTATQVIDAIQRSATRHGPWNRALGWGIIDAARAVKLAGTMR